MMQSRKVSLTKRQGARYGIAFGLLWLLLLPTVFQIARVNAAITNSWISTTPLPIAISGSGALATSNNVYSMGGDFQDRTGIGCPCGATVQVFFAPRLSDGSLGPWTTTTPLPDFRAHFTPLLADGMVYAIGGHRLDGIAQGSSTSFVAPLLSDGSIGSWSTTASLPMTDFSYGATVFNGRIYVVGGSNGFGPRSEVLFSTVNADGSLGGWTFTTPLPIASEHLVVFTFNDRLYALAGSRTGTTTMMAPINTDGSLGAWQTTTPLPFSFVSGLARGLLVGNRIFLLGLQQLSLGQSQLSALTTTIDSDGTLAPWEFGTPFPSPLFSFGFVGDQQALYVIGGGVFGGANRIDSVFFTSPQSQKQPSTISAFVSRDSIPLGQGISVFGSISPAHAAQVTLTYTKPDGTTLTR